MIIKTKESDILTYLEDTSNIQGRASSLYIPQSSEELREIIIKSNMSKSPITIQGGRTGTTGGCVPLEGAVVSTEKLNKIVDIDYKNKEVVVEPGASLEDLENELNKLRLTLRAQPTESLAFAGGVASTCASGTRGFKYKSIRNYIKELSIILTDGLLITIRRGEVFSRKRKFSFSMSGKQFNFSLPGYNMPPVKTQAGYFVKDDMDIIDLFIGSEGTLGVIVKLALSVQEMPQDIFDMVVFFKKETDALSFVDRVQEMKQSNELFPSSLEFFDSNSINFLKTYYSQIPSSSYAVYLEQESDSGDKDELIEKWSELIESYGISLDSVWFADSLKERKKVYEFRHKLPQLINEFLRANNQTKLSTDISVPHENFRTMYSFYKDTAKKLKIDYVNFGHIGENHLHFNFLPLNESEHKKAELAIIEFAREAVSLGGSISAEHGIGKVKKHLLEIMYGRKNVEDMAKLKKYFDPFFILGMH